MTPILPNTAPQIPPITESLKRKRGGSLSLVEMGEEALREGAAAKAAHLFAAYLSDAEIQALQPANEEKLRALTGRVEALWGSNSSSTASAVYELANQFFQRNEFQNALRYYNLLGRTGNDKVHLRQAECYYMLQQMMEAVLSAEIALSINPSNREAFLIREKALNNRGDLLGPLLERAYFTDDNEQALALLNMILNAIKVPGNELLIPALSRKVLILKELGREQDALHLLKNYNLDALANANLFVERALLSAEPEDTYKDLRKAFKISPRGDFVLFGLVTFWVRVENLREAEATLHELPATSSYLEEATLSVASLASAKKPLNRIFALNRALVIDPTLQEPRALRATLYTKLLGPQMALESCQEFAEALNDKRVTYLFPFLERMEQLFFFRTLYDLDSEAEKVLKNPKHPRGILDFRLTKLHAESGLIFHPNENDPLLEIYQFPNAVIEQFRAAKDKLEFFLLAFSPNDICVAAKFRTLMSWPLRKEGYDATFNMETGERWDSTKILASLAMAFKAVKSPCTQDDFFAHIAKLLPLETTAEPITADNLETTYRDFCENFGDPLA